MNLRAIAFPLILVFTTCLPAYAVSGSPGNVHTSSTSPETPTPSATAKSLLKFLDKVPGGSRLKCLVTDFTDIMKPEAYEDASMVQGMNAGLNRYFAAKLAKSLVFRQRAKLFYDEVNSLLASSSISKSPGEAYTGPFLNERAGDTRHADLKPGWVWRLAMKYAEGRPSLAMELIGICGHDDVAQGGGVVPYNQHEANEKYERRKLLLIEAIRKLQSSLARTDIATRISLGATCISPTFTAPNAAGPDFFEETVKNAGECTDKSKIQNIIDQLQTVLASLSPAIFLEGPLSCPNKHRGANFYLPQSLGKKVDISKSLKSRLAAKKSDYKPDTECSGACLPAKYYHVYASAAVACELLVRGHNPHLVAQLSAAAGWYYRVLWISTIASQYGGVAGQDGEDSETALSSAKISSRSESLAQALGLRSRKSKSDSSSGETQEETDTEMYSDSGTMKDALELMRLWTFSGDFGKTVGEMYTNLAIDTVIPAIPMDGPSVLATRRPKGWSDARFRKAEAAYESILADFDWTIQQHRIGSRFAAQVCKPEQFKIKSNSCGK